MAWDRSSNKWFVVAAVAVVLSIIACYLLLREPPEQTAPPAVLPSRSVVPSPSPSPGLKEFEEAKDAYNRAAAEALALAEEGGAVEPTPTLAETLEWDALDVTMRGLQTLHRDMEKVVGRVPTRLYFEGSGDGVVRFTACEDYREQRVLDRHGRVLPSATELLVQQEVSARPSNNGRWRVFQIRSHRFTEFDGRGPCRADR